MPVHDSNCAQDFCSEFDSGLRIDPKIVTVPLGPAYGLNCAQAPVSLAPVDDGLGDEPPLPPPLLPPQAARASTEAPSAAVAATARLCISRSLLQLARRPPQVATNSLSNTKGPVIRSHSPPLSRRPAANTRG